MNIRLPCLMFQQIEKPKLKKHLKLFEILIQNKSEG
jgi:hypothetical protein